jgi:hypothetical protein
MILLVVGDTNIIKKRYNIIAALIFRMHYFSAMMMYRILQPCATRRLPAVRGHLPPAVSPEETWYCRENHRQSRVQRAN